MKEKFTQQVMKRFIVMSVVMMVVMKCVPVNASTLAVASDEELASYMQAECEKMHIPAVSVEIVDAEKTLFKGNYGGCNADTPFILGSISKSFTAVAIMQLGERGLLEVDDFVTEYITNVDKSCRTTIKQLLNQTSGVHTYMTLEDYALSDEVTDWEYANVNYNLLGQIVEQVSGMSYGKYISENIFKPLGMEHSYTSMEEAREAGIADGYRNYFGLMLEQDYEYPQGTGSGWMTIPAAYIISTASDMGKYLQFYLNGGEGILSKESIEKMHGDTVYVQPDYEYGYGWGIDRTSGETILVHGGNVENYTSYMFMLPEYGMSAVVLTNACDYFVSNEMVIQFAYNLAYKLIGMESEDIEAGKYVKLHVLLDAIMLVLVLVAVLPLLLIGRWRRKVPQNVRARSIVAMAVIHGIIPTAYLFIPAMLGAPMSVAARFVPDLYIVLVAGSVALYLTGIIKVVLFLKMKEM